MNLHWTALRVDDVVNFEGQPAQVWEKDGPNLVLVAEGRKPFLFVADDEPLEVLQRFE